MINASITNYKKLLYLIIVLAKYIYKYSKNKVLRKK